MFEAMVLNLANPMNYGITGGSFSSVLDSIYEKEDGYEALFRYRIHRGSDCIRLEMLDSAAGHLLKGPEKAESIMTLKEGRYIFIQLPLPESEAGITQGFLPVAYKSSSDILYVRLLKENSLEAVMQLMLPC